LLTALLGGLLLWGMAQLSARAQEPTILTAGVPASGDIKNAAGDEWIFTACAGNAITVTMQSDKFTPYLELYSAYGVKPLVEADGEDDSAQIDGFVVEDSGSYLLIAAGRRRTDRGAYELTLETSGSAKQEDVDGLIGPGSTMTGTIRARRMAAWGFRGCAGDVVTIQADSDDFDAYAELYRSGGDEILAYDDNSGRSSDAEIADFVLPGSGNYTILVSGATRLDAGRYSLSLTLESGNSNNQATVTRTPTTTRTSRFGATATRTPTRTGTPIARGPTPPAEIGVGRPTAPAISTRTPTPTATPPTATCTVQSSTLNVRYGPGTEYTPPIGSLRRGAVVEMVARNATSTWVQIADSDTGLNGWVSGASQYVECTKTISSLRLGVIPPTPTPRATATPTATPTIAPIARIPTPPTEIGIGGGGGAGLNGSLVADIAMFTGSSDNPSFSRSLYFRAFVWDPDEGNKDGDGIDHVEFEIQEQFGNFRTVHTQRENVAGYCSFGGGEPNCNVLTLSPGARWPSTGIQIEKGSYNIQVTVFLKNSGNTGNWSTDFTVDLRGGASGGGSNGGGAQSPFVLYDGDPRSSSNQLCSRFRTDCGFGDNCAFDQRLVYGPYCRSEDYPNIFNGLYRVRLEGSGPVDAGATDYGPAQETWSFGKQRLNLPGEYTFCWPGRASNGYGFEIMVKNIGQSARVDRITITWLSDSC